MPEAVGAAVARGFLMTPPFSCSAIKWNFTKVGRGFKEGGLDQGWPAAWGSCCGPLCLTPPLGSS